MCMHMHMSMCMYVEGGVGWGAGKVLGSQHKILLKHTDLNQVKSLLCLKGEKSAVDFVLGTTKC